jgi:hypothetical protein
MTKVARALLCGPGLSILFAHFAKRAGDAITNLGSLVSITSA